MVRIRERLAWALVAALGVAVVASLTGVVYGGPLDPPAAPAPTGVNLIFQPAGCGGFPITISSPGSYALAGNITMPGGCAKDGIYIAAANVTLDLRGSSVVGTAAAKTGINVDNISSKENIALSNGVVRGWPVGGIEASPLTSGQIAHVEVTGNGPTGWGGQVTIGSHVNVSDCIVAKGTAGALGLVVLGSGSTVTGCIVTQNDAQGLKVAGGGNRIVGNHATDNDQLTGCADIWLTGPNNFVLDNTAGAGTNDSCPFFIEAGAAGSTIERNVARGGGGFNFWSGCGACDMTVQTGSALATNPWANLSY